MPLDGKAAGAFAADDGPGLVHLGGDPLEAHRYLIADLPKGGRQPVQQMGGGNVAHRRAPPALVLEQVVVQQHQHHVGGHIAALLVNDAQAVRVAVGGNAQIAPVVHHIGGKHPQRFLAGSGHSSAKEGVVLIVDHVHVAPAGQQQCAQAVAADTIHGVNGDSQPGTPDGAGIDHLQDAVDILVEGIPLPDFSRCQGIAVGDAFHILWPQLFDLCLDLPGDGEIRVPAAEGEDFDAIVDGRVVAGGDGQTVGQTHLLHREHDQRRGDAAVDHIGTEPVPRQHLRCPEHGFL